MQWNLKRLTCCGSRGVGGIMDSNNTGAAHRDLAIRYANIALEKW